MAWLVAGNGGRGGAVADQSLARGPRPPGVLRGRAAREPGGRQAGAGARRPGGGLRDPPRDLYCASAPTMDQTSRRLVEDAKRGDADALEALLIQHYPALRAFIRLRLN